MKKCIDLKINRSLNLLILFINSHFFSFSVVDDWIFKAEKKWGQNYFRKIIQSKPLLCYFLILFDIRYYARSTGFLSSDCPLPIWSQLHPQWRSSHKHISWVRSRHFQQSRLILLPQWFYRQYPCWPNQRLSARVQQCSANIQQA